MARILIVDDEKEITALLQEFLTKNKYEAVTCDSGEKALAILEERDGIELVILDHKMPGITGGTVLEEMRQRKIDIPVILLTGSMGPEMKSIRSDVFLQKPIDLMIVLKKVKELLNQ
ncbi:MAG: response regulator [Candidatus Tantalella remota]|nr:response regulator [Candidatus Tantalella remota]